MKKLLSLSIRNQMILLVLLMTVIPLGIAIKTSIQHRNHSVEDAKFLVERTATRISSEQEILLAGIKQLSSTLSRIPVVQSSDTEAVNCLLAELLSMNPVYENILITDESGLVLAAANLPKESVNLSFRRYWINAVATGKFSSGEYVVTTISKIPILAFAYPAKNAAGGVAGVVVVTVHLERYGQMLFRGHSPDFTSLVLTDHNGIILFDANDNSFIGKKDGEEIFNLMKSGSDTGNFEFTGITGKSRIFAYQKLKLEGEQSPYMYVRVGILAKKITEGADSQFVSNMLSIFAVMLPMVCFVFYLTKRGILDRIAALQNATRQVAQGSLEITVAKQVPSGELGELARAFDMMTSRLAEDITERRKVEQVSPVT